MGMGLPGEGKKKKYSDEEILKVLEMTRGNISKSARVMGYNASYLRYRIKQTPELAKALPEIREGMMDALEEKLDKHIFENESLEALKFKMNAQAKQRGYGTTGLNIDMTSRTEHSLDEEQMNMLIDKFKKNLEN